MTLTTQFLPWNPGILLSLWWQAGLFVLSVAALPLDSRKIMGLNPWIKPIKFEVSVAIFLATVGLLLTHLQRSYQTPGSDRIWPQMATLTGWVIGISMIVENTLIALQSFRGVRSHMNYTTHFDTGVFGAMALGVLFNTLALGVLLLLYCDPSTRWHWPASVNMGARLGLGILIWGSLEGVAMVTRQQHTVGAADGGGGVPFLNWSTTNGDLRIAHFFAVHALQLLLGAGWLISRTDIRQRLQTAAMIVLAITYLAGCYGLFRLAKAGRSPLKLDSSNAMRAVSKLR